MTFTDAGTVIARAVQFSVLFVSVILLLFRTLDRTAPVFKRMQNIRTFRILSCDILCKSHSRDK